MVKRNLIDVKTELEKVNNKVNCKQQLYNDLIELPEVKNYIKAAGELEEAIKKKKLLVEEYFKILQSECNHPLWYLLDFEIDSYECKTYWTCKCIECGKVEEDRSKNFENVITGNGLFAQCSRSKYSYEEIKQLYDHLTKPYICEDNQELSINKNDVAKVLVKKYNMK